MTYARQLKFLELVLKNKRVPHAFLFWGRDTVYQKELAKSFFIKLNGPESAGGIKKENHLDTFFVRRLEGKKDVAISQIRTLREFVSKTALVLKKKGVFIEEAQHLNEEGWNALLKTLEEPAGDTVIFILAGSIQNIPPTILSRVVAVPFDAVDLDKKPRSLKDDIILEKLAGLGELSVLARFDLAETISQKNNVGEILDNWLLGLRAKMLKDGDHRQVKVIESVANLRNQLTSTNINSRLALENLFLKI